MTTCALVPLDPSYQPVHLHHQGRSPDPQLLSSLASLTPLHRIIWCKISGLALADQHPLLFTKQGPRVGKLQGLGVTGTAAYKLLTEAVCEGPTYNLSLPMYYNVTLEDGRTVGLRPPDTIPSQDCEAAKYLDIRVEEENVRVVVSLRPSVGPTGRLGWPRFLGPAGMVPREGIWQEQEEAGQEGQTHEQEGQTQEQEGQTQEQEQEGGHATGGCDREGGEGDGESHGPEVAAGAGAGGGGDDPEDDDESRRGRGGVGRGFGEGGSERGGGGGSGGGGEGGGGDDPGHDPGEGGDGDILCCGQPRGQCPVYQVLAEDNCDEGFLREPEPSSPLHHLTEQGRRLWSGVLHPEQMSAIEIQEITKLTPEQFFMLCRETEEASQYLGTGARRTLCHTTRVLILFLRLVKILSFMYIAVQCHTTRPVVTLAYHDILYFLLLRHSSIPCFWNDQNLTAEKLDSIMRTFNGAASPGLRDFMSKFRNSKGLPVSFAVIDTTAVPITKSADPGMAQVTYAGVPGSGKGQSASFGVVVATDGTVIGVQSGPLISGGVRSGMGDARRR